MWRISVRPSGSYVTLFYSISITMMKTMRMNVTASATRYVYGCVVLVLGIASLPEMESDY
jgi:hypothetical protein